MSDSPRSASESREEELADLLAICDEGLARGELHAADLAPRQGVPVSGELQKELACLQLLRQAFPRENATPGSTELPIAVSASAFPPMLGRFQIQKEIGRGGYGVVYLAHDPLLSREVAIKVARGDVPVDEQSSRRFSQEAQAAARLHHPNIVSLYEQGTADGCWFLVSEYCEGVSLAQWIRQQDRMIDPRMAAEIVRQLSDAVEHSHQQGVLHRDLKPANVLLKPGHGSSEVVLPWIPKLTDFGLAKILDESHPSLTRSGVTIGTPCYMPPEQAEGSADRPIGHLSDVYGLGTILYELLTQRPPFANETPLITLRRVILEEPVAPGRLRSGLPKDLETICLKCLEKSPKQRYESAAHLADDLKRFLEDRPILARPISTTGRIVRWTHRQPVIAGLLLSLVVVTFVAIELISHQLKRVQAHSQAAQAALDRIKIEQKLTRAQKERADENFERARLLLTQVTNVGFGLTHEPDLDTTGLDLLDASLASYQELIQEQADDPQLRLENAEVLQRVAQMEWTLDEETRAIAHLRQSVELCRDARTQMPENVQVLRRLVAGLIELSEMLRQIHQLEESKSVIDEAQLLIEGLIQADSSDYESWKSMVAALSVRCRLLCDQREYSPATGTIQQAIVHQTQLVEKTPGDKVSGENLVKLTQQEKTLQEWALAKKEARDLVQSTLPQAEHDWRQNPTSMRLREVMCTHFIRLIDFATRKGVSVAEKLHWYPIAAEVADSLLKDAPGNREIMEHVALVQCHLGYLMKEQGNPASAIDCFRRVNELRIQLDASPQDRGASTVRINWFHIMSGTADLLSQLERHEEAIELAREIFKYDPLAFPLHGDSRRTRLYAMPLARSILCKPHLSSDELAEACELAELSQIPSLRGAVYLHQKRPLEAIRAIQTAPANSAYQITSAGEPQKIDTWSNDLVLALAYAQTGNPQLGRKHLRIGRRAIRGQLSNVSFVYVRLLNEAEQLLNSAEKTTAP